MNDTPLPFTVWAMIATGREVPSGNPREQVDELGEIVAVDVVGASIPRRSTCPSEDQMEHLVCCAPVACHLLSR